MQDATQLQLSPIAISVQQSRIGVFSQPTHVILPCATRSTVDVYACEYAALDDLEREKDGTTD